MLFNSQRIATSLLSIPISHLSICLLVAWAYAPSLSHPPRSDQWAYLCDTMDRQDAMGLFASTYSYNRTRLTNPCDAELFRPILFIALALERACLNGDLASTQSIGILLHCLICMLLLANLRRISALVSPPGHPPSGLRACLPFSLTAFFALNSAIQEQVIWAHLHGYLMFLAFVLVAINVLLHHIAAGADGRAFSPALCSAWVFSLLAAFAYEMGQVIAVLAGLFLAVAMYPRGGIARAGGWLAAFVAIFAIYQVVNRYDMELHSGHYQRNNATAELVRRAVTPATFRHASRFITYTDLQPFFPSLLHPELVDGRLNIPELVLDENEPPAIDLMAALSLIVVASGIGLGIAGLRGLIRHGERLPLLFLGFVASLAAVYAAANVLGRMNLRSSQTVLSANSYYSYTAQVFLLMAASVLWGRVTSGTRMASVARGTLCSGLIALAVYCAFSVRATNQAIVEHTRDTADPIRALQGFIESHRDDPDLSMAIDYDTSDPIPSRYGRRVTDIVFSRWLSPAPKYRVAIRDGMVSVLQGTNP